MKTGPGWIAADPELGKPGFGAGPGLAPAWRWMAGRDTELAASPIHARLLRVLPLSREAYEQGLALVSRRLIRWLREIAAAPGPSRSLPTFAACVLRLGVARLVTESLIRGLRGSGRAPAPGPEESW